MAGGELKPTTTFKYGKEFQLIQLAKYKNSENNHWKIRFKIARDLVDQHVLPRLHGKPHSEIVSVDIGCSIGTFAIEFAKAGFRSYGIDFDPEALKIARTLAQEENVQAEFVCGDVSYWRQSFPPIDLVCCFDIFEHLQDDELGSMLVSIRKNLSPQGCLIFHTCPTEYYYLFKRLYRRLPLIPLRFLSEAAFTRIVKSYAAFVDFWMLLLKGVTHRESIKHTGHCNPTTKERLADIFKRSGYDILLLESAHLYQSKRGMRRQIGNQPITHRNLYGVVVARAEPTYSSS